MQCPCSGVVLAGGLNSRMGGENKALLCVGDQCILDRLMAAFEGIFRQVLLVTNSPLAFLPWNVTMVGDLFPVRSSLTGIHAGLFHASSGHVFVTACDTHFLKKELITFLLEELEPKWDVVIPATEEGLQPLCAVYSKRCLRPIERQLAEGNAKIIDFFSQVRVKEVPEERLRQADPHLLSFFNVNTPEALVRAEEMGRRHWRGPADGG
jgi:molybdopterin-guanine dinucleotide biosynthesis protein A